MISRRLGNTRAASRHLWQQRRRWRGSTLLVLVPGRMPGRGWGRSVSKEPLWSVCIVKSVQHSEGSFVQAHKDQNVPKGNLTDKVLETEEPYISFPLAPPAPHSLGGGRVHHRNRHEPWQWQCTHSHSKYCTSKPGRVWIWNMHLSTLSSGPKNVYLWRHRVWLLIAAPFYTQEYG